MCTELSNFGTFLADNVSSAYFCVNLTVYHFIFVFTWIKLCVISPQHGSVRVVESNYPYAIEIGEKLL